tara:strand:- start:48 stop:1145 length:1098 start_codon:yes stop_codon:yes gene_type:complete
MGTTSSFFGGGGGDPLPQPEWLFQKSSYTYTFPYDGTVIVHVIGGGGSGAAQSSGYLCTGGGAGGYSRKQFSVTSSTTATVTTGSGGLSVGSNSTQDSGIAGSASSFTLSGTLTANGGAAGLYNPSANAFAAGGTASGGDVNYQGGRSGKLAYDWNEVLRACTGGGAVNLFGFSTNDLRGGDQTNLSLSIATGGGGVGGRGGDHLGTNAKSTSGGGGAAGPAQDLSNGPSQQARTSAGGAGGSRLFMFNGPILDGVGGQGLISFVNISSGSNEMPSFGTIGMGAGSGGITATNSANDFGADLQPPSAGLFGGGGGTSSDGKGGHGSHASLGGGGGGCTSSVASSLRRVSGGGGDGVIIIEYIGRG